MRNGTLSHRCGPGPGPDAPGPGPDAPRTRADRAGWTARPTSRDAPGTPDGLRGGRRQACTGSALVVASLERTTTTGHGAACRQSRATGPSGVPAWGAGPAGPRPGRVLPSTSISAPTERSSRTRRRRPVGQLHLNLGRLRAEGLAHHRLQGGFGRGRAEAVLATLTGPRLRCVMRRRQAPVPDEDHVYLQAAQLRFSGRPPQSGDRSWRAVGTHQDSSGGRNLGWHVPTFLAISADGRVSTLIRARTAQHADATESIMHGA